MVEATEVKHIFYHLRCRLALRWGLTAGHTVEATEADLKELLPEASWRDVHLQMIFFGASRVSVSRVGVPRACFLHPRGTGAN